MGKDYDLERAKLEGVGRSFTLCGIEFQCAPAMPAQAFSDMADIGNGAITSRIFETANDAIRATLRPDSRDEWDALLERDDLPVPIDIFTVLTIANDLCETETGRPTSPPSPSTTTPKRTPTGSTDGSDSRAEAASTPSLSVPA